MADSLGIAQDISNEFGLNWDEESLTYLFSEYIDNQQDNATFEDWIRTKAAAEAETTPGY